MRKKLSKFNSSLEIITKISYASLFIVSCILLIVYSVNFALTKLSISDETKISLKGNTTITKQDIEQEITKLLVNNKIVTSGMLKENLEQMNWISKVYIKNNYGSSLEIEIIEKDPIAVTLVDDKLYYLDNEADVIGKSDGIDENLIYIVGQPSGEVMRSITRVVSLIDKFGLSISKVVVKPNKRFEIYISANQTIIKFNHFRIKNDINKLSYIFTDKYFTKNLLPTISVIDLGYNNAFSLKFRGKKLNLDKVT